MRSRERMRCFGQFGAPPKTAVASLDEQIRDGNPAYLYLAYRDGVEICGLRAPLRWVGLGRLPDRYRAAVPDYYADLVQEPSAWFVVGRRSRALTWRAYDSRATGVSYST